MTKKIDQSFLDLEEDGDLGEPPPEPPTEAPALRGRIFDKPEPPSSRLTSLGEPPGDALGAAKWAYKLHMWMAYETLMDPRLTPSQRRKEIRDTLTAAKGHMTDAARYDVKRLIEEDREQVEAKRRGRAAAQKTAGRPPAPAGAKVIPIRKSSGGEI